MKIYLLKVDLGYIGYDMSCLVGSDDKYISEKATELALDHYNSYDLDNENVRSVGDIIEQDFVEQDEAELIQTEEILGNIDIEYVEYDVLSHGDSVDYDWVDFKPIDIQQYLRDYKINEILK